MQTVSTESPRPRRRRRRSRRRTPRAERTRRSARRAKSLPVREWLKAIDVTLRGVEQAAWDLRGLADEAVGAWDAVGRDAAVIENDFGDHADRLARAGSTGFMLAKVVGSYKLQRLKAPFLSERAEEVSMKRLHKKNARRYRRVSEAQGGAFLKLGQLLSARPDLLPPVWIRELSGLQDAAPPLPFSEIRKVLEDEYGRPVEAVFSEFDEEPIAAASIGQVHRATTRDGEDVAVKVQRPDVDKLVNADMEMMELFLEAIRSMLPPTDFDTIISEIRGGIRAELDYSEEVATMDRVHKFLEPAPHLRVPAPRRDLSVGKVLVAEFVEGRKITDVLDELKAQAEAGDYRAGLRVDLILGRVLEMYLKQVLQGGIFQADPHPGNILVAADDTVILLDFGCSKELLPERRTAYLDVLSAYMAGQRERVGDRLMALGFDTQSGRPDTLLAFAEAFLSQFQQGADGQALSWPDAETLKSEAVRLMTEAKRDPVNKLPEDFIMLARVFGTMGGLFNHYKPEIDFSLHVLPIVGAALINESSQIHA